MLLFHCKLYVLTLNRFNLKIWHGAIVNNVATNLYAMFDDDRLWNEKALADRKSDN